jgi:hypothetical protein
MRRLSLFILLMLFSFGVWGQQSLQTAPNGIWPVLWTKPLKRPDGSNADVSSYIVTVDGVSINVGNVLSYSPANPNAAGKYVVSVQAVDSTGTSDPAGPVTVVVNALFRLVQNLGPDSKGYSLMVVAGTVPPATTCDPRELHTAQDEKGVYGPYYRVDRTVVKWIGNNQPPVAWAICQ